MKPELVKIENYKDRKVYSVIQKEFGNTEFSSSELASRLDFTRKTAYNRLKRLEGEGLVECEGTGSGTKWYLKI